MIRYEILSFVIPVIKALSFDGLGGGMTLYAS